MLEEVSLRTEFVDNTIERKVLMGVSVKGDGPYAVQELGEGRVPGQVSA
jgi:hypothetical protein